jgi:SAM-dependent methyltransferase
VRDYFDRKYPNSSDWKALPFRAKASERLLIVQSLLPRLHEKSMCDVGCGDGEQVFRLVDDGNVPSSLVLQDISARAVRGAQARFAAYGARVSGSIGDALVEGIGGPYDVVLAIGLTDYYRDWSEILRVLLEGTREVLIVDFPRKWKLRNVPRRLWLRSKRMRFNAATKREVLALVNSRASSFAIERSTYNWIVKIDKSVPHRRDVER